MLAHALHAEELPTAKKERAKAKTDKGLQLAQAVSREVSVSSRIFSSCGGRTISHGPRPLPTQESRALRILFIISKKRHVNGK